jgi:hypothetical protein
MTLAGKGRAMRATMERVAIILGCLAVGMQFVPAGTRAGAIAPSGTHAAEKINPQVGAIFDRSCQDCHSDRTRLPWYGHVAPMSWILSRDIRKGRAKLDFSQWAGQPHSANERMEICDAVSDGTMPLRAYTLLHRDAKLSKQDVDVICDWAAAPAHRERRRHVASSGDTKTLASSSYVRHLKTKGPQ